MVSKDEIKNCRHCKQAVYPTQNDEEEVVYLHVGTNEELCELRAEPA